MLVGKMLVHYPKLKWPFGHNRLEVPSEILLKKAPIFFPSFSFISLVKYRFVMTINSIDVLVP